MQIINNNQFSDGFMELRWIERKVNYAPNRIRVEKILQSRQTRFFSEDNMYSFIWVDVPLEEENPTNKSEKTIDKK